MHTRLSGFCAGLLALAALAAPAAADDTELLNRVTPPPNAMIIFDTSQSMTWYAPPPDGFTRGDEYPGWPGDTSVKGRGPARMKMAKDALTNVMDTFGDKINFGLATYNLGTNDAASPNQNVEIVNYHYYYDNRTYVVFDRNTALNVIKITNDAANINMPSTPSFTVRWMRDPTPPYPAGCAANPCEETRNIPATAAYDSCDWTRTRYNADGTRRSGPFTEVHGAVGACVPAGRSSTKTRVVRFNTRVSGDDPKPYKYNHSESWTAGAAVPGVGLSTGTNTYSFGSRVPDFTDYYDVYTSLGQVTHAGTPARTEYRWHFWYVATCIANCTGARAFTWEWTTNWSTARIAAPRDPNPPFASLPMDRIYYWSGNNYRIKPSAWRNPVDPRTDPACTVSPNGWTKLVDVGAGTKNAIKNYLGSGADRRREVHGADYSTPLRYALDSALAYFTDPAGPVQSDAQKDCRNNFVILVTDGGESCPLVSLTGAGSPGEAAANLRNAAVNAKGGVITYVVGLDQGGFSPDELTVVTDIAAKGSTDGSGTFYRASNPATLQAALNAIIGSILSQQYTFVSPVVPSVRRVDNLMLIQGMFTTLASPPEDPNTPWMPGELKAYALGPDGRVATVGEAITDPPIFEAGALLAARAANTRTIYTRTSAGAGLVPFDATNAAVRTDMAVTMDVNGDAAVNAADATQVGQVVIGNNGKPFKLNDIFHSTPVVVGPPSPIFTDRTFDPTQPPTAAPVLLSLVAAPDTFAAFRDANSQRSRRIYVGSNGGMLHAFSGGDFNPGTGKYDNLANAGKEEWAFIPTQMLPKLQYLAVNQGHRYYVDGSLKCNDVWLDDNNDGVKTSNEWHTVCVGGFRQGGTGLYALDVTNPNLPVFLWNYATTGESWSEAAIAKVRAQVGGRRVDRWVAVVGDGYSATGLQGRMLHVIDLKTGRALWQVATASSVPASPVLLDINGDGYADRIYAGTVGGEMLRCDVGAVAQRGGGNVDPPSGILADNWSCATLLTAGPAQPFYTAAAATVDDKGKIWVFVGTGDRSRPLLNNPTPNRLYGVVDTYVSGSPAPAPLSEADLTDVTNVNTLDTTAIRAGGWFIRLRPFEKEFAETSLVFNGEVIFTTFKPGAAVAGCAADVGSGAIYMVYYKTGGGMADLALFRADTPQASGRVYQVNAGVTMRPVITAGAQGANAVLYLGNSNLLTINPTFNAPSSIRATQYWRIVP